MDDRRRATDDGRQSRKRQIPRAVRAVPRGSLRLLLSTLLAGGLTLALPTPQPGSAPRALPAPAPAVATGGRAALLNGTLPLDATPTPTVVPTPPPSLTLVPPTGTLNAAEDDERHHVPPHLSYQVEPPAPTVVSIAAPDDDERHHRPPYRAFDGTPPPSPTPEVTPFAGGALATTTSPARYIVRSGDTLSGIAARFGMTVDTLVFINRLPARNYIWPGEVLAIADASSTPTPLPVEADPTPTLAPVEISPTLTPLPIADAPVTPTQPPTVAPDRQADLLPQAAEVIVEFGHYPWGTPHYGLDLQAPSGTAVTAPVGGVVVEVTTGCVVGAVTCGNGWGNHVWWRSALTEHYLLVAHFTAISVGLAPGVAITAGTLLGYSGTTGYSTGPHVHIQTSASGPDDASAFDPSLELPWETCGHTPPHLGDAWGSTTGCY